MSNLTPELQNELDQEAKSEAKKLTGRVPIFRMGYEAGHYDGAEKYAEKWQEEKERADRYEKALQLIEQFSDPGDYWKAICDMKAIASEALKTKTRTDEQANHEES